MNVAKKRQYVVCQHTCVPQYIDSLSLVGKIWQQMTEEHAGKPRKLSEERKEISEIISYDYSHKAGDMLQMDEMETEIRTYEKNKKNKILLVRYSINLSGKFLNYRHKLIFSRIHGCCETLIFSGFWIFINFVGKSFVVKEDQHGLPYFQYFENCWNIVDLNENNFIRLRQGDVTKLLTLFLQKIFPDNEYNLPTSIMILILEYGLLLSRPKLFIN